MNDKFNFLEPVMKKDRTNAISSLASKAGGLALVAVFCFGLTAHAQDIRLPGNLGGLLRDLGAKNGINTNNLDINPSGSGNGTSNAATSGGSSPTASPSAVSAAPASHLEGGDNRFSFFLSEVNDTKVEVDKYTSPKEKIYLVPEKFEPYLLYAVSKRGRAEWYKTTVMTDAQKQAMDTALDALAASAAQKLPVFLPEDKKFAFGSPQEKTMVKTNIPDWAQLKIHKIGLMNSDWVIAKNNLGFPLYRTKAGFVWFRGKPDHPYCWLYRIDINQSYQGGGSYASSQTKYDRAWLSGCP